MKEKAIKYYKEGSNCSVCLIKAANDVFNLNINQQCFDMCKGVRTGYGIGSMCNALEAGIFVLGLIYDERTVNRLRIKLLTLFQSKYRANTCSKLQQKLSNKNDCSMIIGDVAQILERIIKEETIY